MIEISNVWTGGFEGAITSMRNPYESQSKSDSVDCRGCEYFDADRYACSNSVPCPYGRWLIGDVDMSLAKKLIKGGPEHRKFLRMIHVQADVKAPRYWWQEASTYKFMETNSSSTMHLITKRELTIDDFSVDTSGLAFIGQIVEVINGAIRRYNEAEDKVQKEWEFRAIKQLLPESFNQLRTIDTNYECLLSIYHQRKSHRLSEWHKFSEWCLTLPYFKEFIE